MVLIKALVMTYFHILQDIQGVLQREWTPETEKEDLVEKVLASELKQYRNKDVNYSSSVFYLSYTDHV